MSPSEEDMNALTKSSTDVFTTAINGSATSLAATSNGSGTKDGTIAKFTLRLRQAAIHCDYGDFIDRNLIGQLLRGLTGREMCSKIIQKNPSTFVEAYKAAHSLESTKHTPDEVKSITPISENVNLLSNPGLPNLRKSNRTSQTVMDIEGVQFHQEQNLRKRVEIEMPQQMQLQVVMDVADVTNTVCALLCDAECYNCNNTGHVARSGRNQAERINSFQYHQESPVKELDFRKFLNRIEEINSMNPN
ncbi:hypothetical protein QAD02_002004 [Eretmocerus hayati]|uniref:Uncharacterized protein n=1 Tax=Eretmocerus hayati TaxID=131215 RepID=A0ACC2NHV3_9HYME|nr:hypothetical protein QAD02_002004 [Eretmocerus hayati]